MTDATLTIGQVAARAGLAVSAIRYYEREGLLPEPERVGGQRRYADDTVRRLAVIVAAKQAGFSLDEVRVLLSTTDEGAALIDRATTMRELLSLATRCDCETLDVCAVLNPAQ